jgi:hypothetical protein
MTDPLKPPIITPIDAAADAVGRDEESGLPDHELRETPTAGGEVMSQGGTAVDRRTGTLDEDEPLEEPDNPDEVVPTSHLPG